MQQTLVGTITQAACLEAKANEPEVGAVQTQAV